MTVQSDVLGYYRIPGFAKFVDPASVDLDVTLAAYLEATGTALVDGGTDSGVMRLIGEARADRGGALIGHPLSELPRHIPNVDCRVAAIYRGGRGILRALWRSVRDDVPRLRRRRLAILGVRFRSACPESAPGADCSASADSANHDIPQNPLDLDAEYALATLAWFSWSRPPAVRPRATPGRKRNRTASRPRRRCPTPSVMTGSATLTCSSRI